MSIEYRTKIGTFKNFDIFFRPAIRADDSDTVAVDFPHGERSYKNVNCAKAAINASLRKAAKRERPKKRVCWIEHVGVQRFAQYSGAYEIRHGHFVGHDAKTGKPILHRLEKQHNTLVVPQDKVHSVYAYVPGVTEAFLAPLCGAMTAYLRASREVELVKARRPKRRGSHDRSVKALERQHYGGSRVGVIGAIELDEKAVAEIEAWEEAYRE